jgi:phospholipid/cholesterol/gamma-HCH transport system substrate-binding protein
MKRLNDFVVGITIVVATALIVGATLWMKQSDLGRRRHEVVGRFRDVGNVKVGAHVVLRGVRSGRVRSMELAPDGWVLVHLSLEPGTEVPDDPVVLLNEASLFGEWQATLMSRQALPRDQDVAQQIAESSIDRSAMPGATLPGIAKLTAVAGAIAGDVANVAERFQVAFDDTAARELRLSIRNVAELSNVLAQTVKVQSRNLGAMSEDVNKGVASLVQASEDVRQIAERFDSSTARGEVRQVVEDAATAARELRETSRRLLALSGQLGESQRHLDSFLATGDSVMGKINRGQGSLGRLVNDSTFYQTSDSLMRELLALVTDIRKNPRRYVNVRIF